MHSGKHEILLELYLPKHMMELVIHNSYIQRVGMVLLVSLNHLDNNFHVFLSMAVDIFQALLVLFIHMDHLEPMTIRDCS